MYNLDMKQIRWGAEKNEYLKATRSVCFEDVVVSIEAGGLLDDIEHSNSSKYPKQRILIVLIVDYVYSVPYVSNNEGVFLKTIYPSRKHAALYITEKGNGKNTDNR